MVSREKDANGLLYNKAAKAMPPTVKLDLGATQKAALSERMQDLVLMVVLNVSYRWVQSEEQRLLTNAVLRDS